MAEEGDAKARSVGTGRLGPTYAEIAAYAREAYQRGRNEADTAAERRGIERAAKWHDRNAEACKTLIAEGFEVEANAHEYAFHKNAADHLRAVAQRMADAGPTEPAGASDREGT